MSRTVDGVVLLTILLVTSEDPTSVKELSSVNPLSPNVIGVA